MPLDSYVNTTNLHKLGHDAVSRVYVSLPDAQTLEERPKIPSPALFDFSHGTPAERTATDSRDTSKDARDAFNRLPSVAECAAHLELLETFYVIRQKILVSTEIDKAMHIKPNRETKTGKKGDTKTLKDETFWDRRQAKWDRYLEFAAVRFLAWKDSLTAKVVVQRGEGPRVPEHLPPLDVIMVWHSFLLNPKLFYQVCKDDIIWKLRLPWEDIHAAIHDEEWTFALGRRDKISYETTSNLPSDLYQSFCNWDPPTHKPLYSWEKDAANKNGHIELTEFGLERTRLIPSYKGPPDTPHGIAMSTYTSIFQNANVQLAGQLKEAVIRQATFVDKMNAHLWIRSPAVEGTLRRAIDRYTKFLGILARKKFTIVPTLDVDLAWHTNQCFSGLGYASAMKARVGRFINHDDTIAKDTLGDGFGETRKLWRVYYGKEYRICGCWDCEALTSEIERTKSSSDLKAIADKVQRDVEFHRVVEVRRRKKQPLPRAPSDS